MLWPAQPAQILLALLLSVGLSALHPDSAVLARNASPPWRLLDEDAAARDTVPAIRYGLNASSGYGRIRGGNVTDWYGSLTLLPELSAGKFGMGLLVDLRVNTATWQLRSEDFDSARDYLSLLYFVRYGTKQDSAGYARFGSLEDVSLGYGQFVDRYRNTVSLDDPMRGVVAELPTDHFRFEALFNDFVRPGVFGAHGSYYPFGTEAATAFGPKLSFGISVAGDLSDEGAWVNLDDPGAPFVLPGSPAADTLQRVATGTRDGALLMAGLDAGVRWIQTDDLSLTSFVEAAKMLDYGVGASLGVRGAGTLGPVDLQVQYAQRFLGAEFLPDLFGPTYEAERIRDVVLPVNGQTVSAANTRRNELAGRRSSGIGHHVQLNVNYGSAFKSSVGYETIYGVLGSGRFHFDAELHAADIPVSVRIGYDRFRMDALADVFDASWDDALYQLGVAYEVVGPVRLGMEVSQSYETVYRDGQAAGRTKQNRINPFIQVIFQF